MELKADKAIYSKEVVLKTAFTLTSTAYIHLSQDDSYWFISYENKDGYHQDIKEIENELIAQATRQLLVERTAEIRKLILARAYASTMMEVSPIISHDNGSNQFSDKDEKSILRGWFDEDNML